MFGRKITLCRLFGIPIHVDISWLLIATLVAWTLARDWFPHHFPRLSPETYWLMGVAGVAGLLFSIVFHEMAHSLVARRQGISIRGITLFVFGGVAEMEDEPPSARAEFWMTIVGPVSSAILAVIFWTLRNWCYVLGLGAPLFGILDYLMVINFVLAAFNMIPAFPLDGGRILRSLLWAWKGSLRWATAVCSNIGSGFGIVLIVLGAIQVVGGVGWGVWWIFVGLFVRYAAQMSYQQMLVRRGLEGERVGSFMREHPVTVPSDITLRDFVDNHVYRHHYKMFPVVDGEHLAGSISVSQLKQISVEDWGRRKVVDVLLPCSEQNTISPNADATHALSRMNRNKVSRLMVVEAGRLLGVITLKDLLDFLSLKVELGEE